MYHKFYTVRVCDVNFFTRVKPPLWNSHWFLKATVYVLGTTVFHTAWSHFNSCVTYKKTIHKLVNNKIKLNMFYKAYYTKQETGDFLPICIQIVHRNYNTLN